MRTRDLFDKGVEFENDVIFFRRLFGSPSRVEGSERKLGTRLSDRLRRNDTDGFPDFDDFVPREVLSVTANADAVVRFARKHGAELYFFDARFIDFFRQIAVDVTVDIAQKFSGNRMDDALDRIVADDALGKRNENFVSVFDRRIVDAVDRAAVVFVDDDILRNVDEAPRHITGVRGFERGVGQTFSRTVRRNKEFDNGQTFFKVRADRQFDDVAVRFCHKTAHRRKL